MRKLVSFFIATILVSGCTTFGTFSNVKKGESTTEDVQAMLGEPLEKKYEADQEIWKYQFMKEDPVSDDRVNMQTVLNLDMIFKNSLLEKYFITVSKTKTKIERSKSKTETRFPRPDQDGKRPPMHDRKDGMQFINAFDRDKDGRVSKNEFPGPDHIFLELDKNQSGFIEPDEAPDKSQHPRKQKPFKK